MPWRIKQARQSSGTLNETTAPVSVSQTERRRSTERIGLADGEVSAPQSRTGSSSLHSRTMLASWRNTDLCSIGRAEPLNVSDPPSQNATTTYVATRRPGRPIAHDPT